MKKKNNQNLYNRPNAFLALEEASQIVCKMARDEVLAGPTLYQVCKSCNFLKKHEQKS